MSTKRETMIARSSNPTHVTVDCPVCGVAVRIDVTIRAELRRRGGEHGEIIAQIGTSQRVQIHDCA